MTQNLYEDRTARRIVVRLFRGSHVSSSTEYVIVLPRYSFIIDARCEPSIDPLLDVCLVASALTLQVMLLLIFVGLRSPQMREQV